MGSVSGMALERLQTLRGMVDLLPRQTMVWQQVEEQARQHFQRAGVREIRTPLLEATALFARGIGEATDVVGKEMYSFQDRGQRSCTLRPEGTASVVRAAIQHGLLNQGPQRLWYMGPMFRYERPQAGRQRQFHQIGLELLGVADERSDVDAMAMAWDLLDDLGIQGLQLQINTLGTPEDRRCYREKLVCWLEQRVHQLDPDSRRRLATNPLRILDSKNKATQDLLGEAPQLLTTLGKESRERFEGVCQLLQALDIPFVIDPQLVRGLDYYTHTAFEITSDQLGAQATVCGGGRYDGLAAILGGPPTAGMGWAMGMERLVLLLGQRSEATPPQVVVLNRGDTAQVRALVLARQLRQANLQVELDLSGAAFARQFKRADRLGGRLAVIIGEQEAQAGVVKLKWLHQAPQRNSDLTMGEEWTVPAAEVSRTVERLLTGQSSQSQAEPTPV